MTEKELKKLTRQELLEVLLAQSKKIDRLQRQLNEAKEQLARKELNISEAGSIAEASLVLNNIFADAQNAADQYLDNIRLMHEQAEKELAEARAARARAEEPAEMPAPEEPAEMPEEISEIPDEQVWTDAVQAGHEVPAEAALAESLAAAEHDRKAAAEYLEEIRQLKEQTERDCAEKRKRTDRQIRVSLIRTKKAVHQMLNLYADEVIKRMKHLKDWDRQMEALHERKIEQRSSKSHR